MPDLMIVFIVLIVLGYIVRRIQDARGWGKASSKQAQASSEPNVLDLMRAKFGKEFPISYTRKNYGIAISEDRETIALWENGYSGLYHRSDIREHRWEIPGYVITEAPNTLFELNDFERRMKNAASKRNSILNSGLFVNVKDLNHPKFQIFMNGDVAAMEQWHEILRQFTEGSIPAGWQLKVAH